MHPPGAEQLVVRQHERIVCRLAAHVRVTEDLAEQVVIARSVGDGMGAVEAFITDASRGGLGIESNVFFPRGCRVIVRVRASGTTPVQDLTLRVQRVSMLDRKPTYYIGLSFVSKGLEHEQSVARLLELARISAAAQAPPPKGGA
jgi:hypothetical protein